MSGTLNAFLKLNLTLTSNKEPEINSNSLFSILIRDSRLLVSAFILLETKSIFPKKILSLKLDNLTSTGRFFFINAE